MYYCLKKECKLCRAKDFYEIYDFLSKLYQNLNSSILTLDLPKTLALDKFENNISQGTDIFIFHSAMKQSNAINFKDVLIDLSNFDYNEILRLNIKNLLQSKKINRVFLFSNTENEFIKEDRVTYIKVNIDEKKLMFERVLCMYSFIHSKLFQNNICFLDSDAFLNPNKLDLFNYDFNIALTHRSTLGFMPVNEGVIFVKNVNKHQILNFFEKYLKIFLAIGSSQEVLNYYKKDVFQWRGGQLSLNLAIFKDEMQYLDFETKIIDNLKILFLPVFNFNFSIHPEAIYSNNYLKNKAVLHFKGDLKSDKINYIRELFN